MKRARAIARWALFSAGLVACSEPVDPSRSGDAGDASVGALSDAPEGRAPGPIGTHCLPRRTPSSAVGEPVCGYPEQGVCFTGASTYVDRDSAQCEDRVCVSYYWNERIEPERSERAFCTRACVRDGDCPASYVCTSISGSLVPGDGSEYCVPERFVVRN